ncbi:MAG TPA: hypothetical protein G4O00_07815 [Thermoflexia bacterium]|jgi:cell division protein FtsB|nr:hypothetical protein [Thermoflexia bacterium]
MGKRLSQNFWAIPIILGTCLLLIFLLGRNIPEQVERLEKIQDAQAQLQPYIDRERQYNQALQEELEEVASPEFVEKWARENQRWARPGEVVLSLPTPAPDVLSPEN